MVKKAYFFIDDVIWTFRDIARERPKSLFDNPFMKMLKKAHDIYGMKVQLNVFLRTDFYYGNDEFKLSEMPDCYKSEFEGASDWLKLALHAKQEFPDYPYVNAEYDDVKENYDEFKEAVIRFAGEGSISLSPTIHWGAMSLDGCRALYDEGVKLLGSSFGYRKEFNGDKSTLPYGHAERILQNRKPEAMVFTRVTHNTAIKNSVCSHNFVEMKDFEETADKLTATFDEKTGLYFKKLCIGPCLNLSVLDELEDEFKQKHLGSEYLGYATHEQYFYPEYFAYQPDYSDKILKAAEIIQRNGYEYFFAEEIVK